MNITYERKLHFLPYFFSFSQIKTLSNATDRISISPELLSHKCIYIQTCTYILLCHEKRDILLYSTKQDEF